MNKLKLVITTLLFLCAAKISAQLDSLPKDPNYRGHMTLSETFFGNEDIYQVCYPKGHRPFFYFIIIFAVSTVVLSVLIIYIKNKNNKNLKEKNDIIAEQNKDLIDSINYAQRIQQAILPDPNTLNEVFSNGFVLYRPKHIVSGDFYWIHKIDNWLFAAVFDCTGHGVPGAFLTMLAHNAITKAVVENELTDPAQILNSMNVDVKNALKQTQTNSVQDGMEAGIICVDTQTRTVKFAGANISLQLVQNGQTQMITSGKCSVGSSQQAVKLPETIILNLQTGDAVYMYSDGFADQFGGPKGKKFKYKQLENLLAINSNCSLQEQKQIAEKTFTDWLGVIEQTDDVTVIGLKM